MSNRLRPAACLAAALASACATTTTSTKKEPAIDTLHGTAVADPQRWLEDVKSPEVQAWMSAQDASARTALRGFPGRDALAERFRELYYVDSVSAPRKRGGRFFYVRTHANKDKAITYWRDGEAGTERVLLDPNGWSTDGSVSLGTSVVSWDGRKVVFSKKANAADEATLYVLDVDSGTTSAIDVIEGAKYASPAWTPDSKGFYYEWLPTDPAIPVDARPGYTELRFHALGTDPKVDPVVHERTGDPQTFLGGQISRNGRWLVCYVQHGWNATEVWFKDLKTDGPKDPWRLFAKRDETSYTVDFVGDDWFVQTDEGASNGRIFKASPGALDRASWKEIIPEDREAKLEGFDFAGGRLVANYLRRASGEIRSFALDGTDARTVKLPGIGAVHAIKGDPDDDELYYQFSSFTTPMQVYRTSVAKGGETLWAKVQLPIDPSKYEVEQVSYPSKDGTAISMFLVHRKGLAKDGTNPTLLYGYGGFNVSLEPNFRGSIFPWLDAGGLYAVPNLRGGGEYGKAWHDAGKGALKQNVFDDFAAAAEYLVREKWTTAKKLAIRGGSNGGLLVGAAMTQHPDYYGAVVCEVPLLDMVRYHLFGSGRTWIPEYGSAEDPAQFATLHAYSPYHRLTPGTEYPPLLMMSADADDRVDPMHARKFVAQLVATGSKAPVLLRIEKHSGHGGADLVREAIQMSADQFAFLFATLGVPPPAAK